MKDPANRMRQTDRRSMLKQTPPRVSFMSALFGAGVSMEIKFVNEVHGGNAISRYSCHALHRCCEAGAHRGMSSQICHDTCRHFIENAGLIQRKTL
jgi:hypothetical protein